MPPSPRTTGAVGGVPPARPRPALCATCGTGRAASTRMYTTVSCRANLSLNALVSTKTRRRDRSAKSRRRPASPGLLASRKSVTGCSGSEKEGSHRLILFVSPSIFHRIIDVVSLGPHSFRGLRLNNPSPSEDPFCPARDRLVTTTLTDLHALPV